MEEGVKKIMNTQLKVAVIDYGMGNLRSVKKILEYFDIQAFVTNDGDQLKKADKIIMPGVGAFPDAMKNLKKLRLIDALEKEVHKKQKPFLGICLGMQLLAKKGYEVRQTPGLGWIDAEVKPFNKSMGLRVPHMGWDHVSVIKKSALFEGVHADATFYFVHSYNIQCHDESIVTSTCEYGEVFTASIQKGNIFGTQFHPEKSQANGVALIDNFLKWEG
jgi:glutamine amidotransferase